MKHKPNRPDVRTREALPKVENGKKGVAVLCPFCKPSHAILPGVRSPCGTILDIKAIQPILLAHTARRDGVKCLKCGETGKEMIQYHEGFICLEDCRPNLKLVTEHPPLSNVARFVHGLPAKLRAMVEKRLGIVIELKDFDKEGNVTGKTLGYFFSKGENLGSG